MTSFFHLFFRRAGWRFTSLKLALLFFVALSVTTKTVAETTPLTRVEIVEVGVPERPFDVSRFQGRTTVLYVWGDWCRACARSTPELIALAERFPGVGFVFINTDDPARSLKEKHPDNLVETKVDRAYFGDTVMRKKGFRFSELGLVFGIPAYFVIDPQGRVVSNGNGSRYPATLDALLQSLSASSFKG